MYAYCLLSTRVAEVVIYFLKSIIFSVLVERVMGHIVEDCFVQYYVFYIAAIRCCRKCIILCMTNQPSLLENEIKWLGMSLARTLEMFLSAVTRLLCIFTLVVSSAMCEVQNSSGFS